MAMVGVSLNSSAERAAQRLLDDAFAVLREEAPAHHAALRDVIAKLSINIEVRAERFAATVVDGAIHTTEPVSSPDVVVTTTLIAAQRLLEGRCTLVEAIEASQLDVRGNADALDSASAAFSLFLNGLVRAPSAPGLLRDLNQSVASSGGSS